LRAGARDCDPRPLRLLLAHVAGRRRSHAGRPTSRVGLHGNYSSGGGLLPEAPQKLRDWIVHRAPDVDQTLMEKWIHLPSNKWMMYFYNDKAELCQNGACTPVDGRTARNAGLSTR